MASVSPPLGPLSELDRIRSLVGRYFTIYETRTTPYSLIFLVNIDPTALEGRFNQLAREMWGLYYIPQIRLEHGEHLIEVVRRPQRKTYGGKVNWLMLVLTALSTLFAGAFLWVSYEGGSGLTLSDLLWGGVFFAAPLMAILGLHELAHYFTARKHQVEASLPFFLPMPPPFVIFGTFGAFISLREPIPNRKALMDIGVSGPLAGFAAAIPVTLAGLFLSLRSPVLPLTNCGPTFLSIPYGDLVLGPSVIWWFLGLFFPVGLSNLSPLAIAGWVGLLVTSINLLPAGQLDGGHVFRALLGRRSTWVSIAAVVVLLVLGLFYTGWIFFALLVLFLGVRHPPPLNDLSPLDTSRKLLGLGAAAVLVAGFAFIPIATPTGLAVFEQRSVGAYDNTTTDTNLTVGLVNQDFVSHAYFLSINITPSAAPNASAFLSQLHWSLSWSGGGSTGFLKGTGGTIALPFALNVTGGSTEVLVLNVQDPVASAFNATYAAPNPCAGIQHLEYSGPSPITVKYLK